MTTLKTFIVNTFLIIMAFIIIMSAVEWIIGEKIHNLINEKNTAVCLSFKQQADEFRDNHVFYITEYEEKMCSDLNIFIDAPVYVERI